MSIMTIQIQQCGFPKYTETFYKQFVNIFVQHRLKYDEYDVGSETHQEEIDSKNKHGRDKLIKMSLVEMKTS